MTGTWTVGSVMMASAFDPTCTTVGSLVGRTYLYMWATKYYQWAKALRPDAQEAIFFVNDGALGYGRPHTWDMTTDTSLGVLINTSFNGLGNFWDTEGNVSAWYAPNGDKMVFYRDNNWNPTLPMPIVKTWYMYKNGALFMTGPANWADGQEVTGWTHSETGNHWILTSADTNRQYRPDPNAQQYAREYDDAGVLLGTYQIGAHNQQDCFQGISMPDGGMFWVGSRGGSSRYLAYTGPKGAHYAVSGRWATHMSGSVDADGTVYFANLSYWGGNPRVRVSQSNPIGIYIYDYNACFDIVNPFGNPQYWNVSYAVVQPGYDKFITSTFTQWPGTPYPTYSTDFWESDITNRP